MSEIYTRLFLLSALAGLPLHPTHADPVLPTLLVSATRSEQSGIKTPASITVITQQEISEFRPRNLTDLLQFRGGLQIVDPSGNGQNATIDMRGFGPTAGSNTLVLVDGRRLNNSSDQASPDLNSIDIHNIERIEIIQGSAGILFGNQAVGGLINIITRQPEQFQAQITTSAGDYAGYNLFANIGDQLKNGLSYRFSGKKAENDNYRDNNQTDRKEVNLHLGYNYTSGVLFLEHQYLDDFQQLPGSLFTEELAVDRRQSVDTYAEDFSHSYSHISRLGLQQELTSHWLFEAEYTYRDNERDFQTSFRTFPGSEATQDRTVETLNPRFIGTYPFSTGELIITAGTDFERTDYTLQTSFGPQLLDQGISAYYGQIVIPTGRGWSFTAGLRHAEIENTISSGDAPEQLNDSVTIGSLGAVYRPAHAWRLFMRADQNYRFATVDEHTNVVFGQPVGIENQTGISYEAGVEWNTAVTQAKLVIYQLDLQDEISFDSSTYSNINLDETQRQGIILEGSYAIHPRFILGGSFTYTNPQIAAGPFEGNRIPLVAEHTARFFSHWEFASHWSLPIEAFYASERVLGGDFDNAFSTMDEYAILNTGVGFQNGPWQLNLRINNLLNQAYHSSGAVGYDETFTLRDAYFPAAERNLWLSVEYNFL